MSQFVKDGDHFEKEVFDGEGPCGLVEAVREACRGYRRADRALEGLEGDV